MGKEKPPRPDIKARNLQDPLAQKQFMGMWYSNEEYERLKAWNEECRVWYENRRERWEETPQGKLCLELHQKFLEYKKCLEENPHGTLNIHGEPVNFPEHKLFAEALKQTTDYQRECAERDRMNLEKARLAERCEHKFLDGARCGSPKMKGAHLCYMHLQMKKADALKVELGALEDAESIQLAIKRVLKAVVDGTLEQKIVVQMTNLLQIAAWNVTRTRTGMRGMEIG